MRISKNNVFSYNMDFKHDLNVNNIIIKDVLVYYDNNNIYKHKQTHILETNLNSCIHVCVELNKKIL